MCVNDVRWTFDSRTQRSLSESDIACILQGQYQYHSQVKKCISWHCTSIKQESKTCKCIKVRPKNETIFETWVQTNNWHPQHLYAHLINGRAVIFRQLLINAFNVLMYPLWNIRGQSKDQHTVKINLLHNCRVIRLICQSRDIEFSNHNLIART